MDRKDEFGAVSMVIENESELRGFMVTALYRIFNRIRERIEARLGDYINSYWRWK